jgi:hypothetical protein
MVSRCSSCRVLARIVSSRGAAARLCRIDWLCGGHRRVYGALAYEPCEETAERLDRQLAQPLALRDQPLLERRLADGESLEQVAPVEIDRLFRGLDRARGRETLERGGVHVHRAFGEHHAVVVDHEGRRLRQRPSQHEQRFTEVLAGTTVVDVGPQQSGELVSGLALRWVEGQVGQKRLNLAPAERLRSPGRQAEVEAAQDAQAQRGHLGQRLYWSRPHAGPHAALTPAAPRSRHVDGTVRIARRRHGRRASRSACDHALLTRASRRRRARRDSLAARSPGLPRVSGEPWRRLGNGYGAHL